MAEAEMGDLPSVILVGCEKDKLALEKCKPSRLGRWNSNEFSRELLLEFAEKYLHGSFLRMVPAEFEEPSKVPKLFRQLLCNQTDITPSIIAHNPYRDELVHFVRPFSFKEEPVYLINPVNALDTKLLIFEPFDTSVLIYGLLVYITAVFAMKTFTGQTDWFSQAYDVSFQARIRSKWPTHSALLFITVWSFSSRFLTGRYGGEYFRTMAMLDKPPFANLRGLTNALQKGTYRLDITHASYFGEELKRRAKKEILFRELLQLLTERPSLLHYIHLFQPPGPGSVQIRTSRIGFRLWKANCELQLVFARELEERHFPLAIIPRLDQKDTALNRYLHKALPRAANDFGMFGILTKLTRKYRMGKYQQNIYRYGCPARRAYKINLEQTLSTMQILYFGLIFSFVAFSGEMCADKCIRARANFPLYRRMSVREFFVVFSRA